MTVAATVVVFVLIGWAASVWAGVAVPAAWGARAASMLLLGVGTNGLVLYGLGTLGVPLTRAVVAAPVAVACILLVVRFRPVLLGRTRRPRLAGLALCVPLAAALAAGAILTFMDYDGRVTWLPKAFAIAHEQSITGPFFRGERGLNLHNHYPLLLPLNAATLAQLTGRHVEDAARWLYLLIPVAFLLMMRERLALRYGPVGSWCVASLAWLPVLYMPDGGVLSAYSDLAVAAFLGAAMIALKDGDMRAAGIWLSFLVLTKNEGQLLALIVVFTASATCMRKGRTAWAHLLIPAATAAVFVLAWRSQIPPAYDEQNAALLADLPRYVGRTGVAAAALLQHALNPAEWGLFWPIVSASVGISLWRRAVDTLSLLLVTLGIGGYVATLAVTGWEIGELAKVAANRLLLHLVIPATCIVAGAWSSLGPASTVHSTHEGP